MKEFRCKFCNRLLAKVDQGSRVEIKCPKCKTINLYQEETVIIYEVPENNITKKIVERGLVKEGFREALGYRDGLFRWDQDNQEE